MNASFIVSDISQIYNEIYYTKSDKDKYKYEDMIKDSSMENIGLFFNYVITKFSLCKSISSPEICVQSSPKI